MAAPGSDSQSKNYHQGHSNYTIATHLRRTAESDAAFLLPHLKETDHILDVGCGPGTITTSLSKYVPKGSIIGVDNATAVLQKAQSLAAEAKIPSSGGGSVIFEQGDVLAGLPYADNTFDVVFASQVLGHFPPPDVTARAIVEMRRVLKPDGVLATRDGGAQHFYPLGPDLERLWVQRAGRAYRSDSGAATGPIGMMMPALFRRAGFDVDGGKLVVGAATKVTAGREAVQWLAWRATGQLQPGDAFYQAWLDAGISEDEIQETLDVVKKWADTDDAWHITIQCDMLAWK